MDLKNTNYIKEALQMQPLSDEEKASRHILGRLYGPIATCKEKTRNGRGYNRELWQKALADDIFKEKVANKSLFLELGHPTDREETDMRCVCACIPELPKIIGDDLYAYVDILDTDNGRLLKTLCDYGFIPGISSRGSGDVMDNDEVDPDTFFLETWDIVQLPAVKKARLNICESVDNKSTKLAAALKESYSKASVKGKAAMKEACENLGITTEEFDSDEIDEGILDNIKYRNDPEFQEKQRELALNKMDARIEKAATKTSKEKAQQAKLGVDTTKAQVKQAKLLVDIEKTNAKQLRAKLKTMKVQDKLGLSDDEILAILGIKEGSSSDKDGVISQYRLLIKKYPDEEIITKTEYNTLKNPAEIKAQTGDLVVITRDINIKEAVSSCYKGGTPKDIDEIPETPEISESTNNCLKEEAETAEEAEEEFEEAPEDTEEVVDSEVAIETVEEPTEEDTESEGIAEVSGSTVGEMIDQFKEYDPDMVVEFDTVNVDGKEYALTSMSLDDSEDGKIVVGFDCVEVGADTEDEDQEPDESEFDDEEFEDETETVEIEAEDTGSEDVVESIKDLVRQNGLLENTIKELKSAKAVGDAKVEELTEELNKYKKAFIRTSKIAGENPELKQQIQSLTEQVEKQAPMIKQLQESVENAKVNAKRVIAERTKALSEKLEEAQAHEEELNEQLATTRENLRKQSKMVASYKAKCQELQENYVASKAAMLGVNPSEITNKLTENYTIADVDKVYNTLLESARPAFSLGTTRKAAMKINENAQNKKSQNFYDPDAGYDIDDDLLILAGLK